MTIDLPSFRIIDFQYQQLHLINKNWRKYIKMANPVAAAFLSKMNYTKNERVQVKIEFLRMVSRMELDPAKKELIYGFFETYLKLSETEEKQMHEEINKLPREEVDRVLELPNNYRDQGKAEGRAEERKQIALKMLRKGMSDEEIANIIGITVNRVKELRNELQ